MSCDARFPLAQDEDGHVAPALAQSESQVGSVRRSADEVEDHQVGWPRDRGRESAFARGEPDFRNSRVAGCPRDSIATRRHR